MGYDKVLGYKLPEQYRNIRPVYQNNDTTKVPVMAVWPVLL